MTVIQRLPAQSIIDGFRGVLDYYEDKGQFIVRRWPRNKTGPTTAPALAIIPPFVRANRLKRYHSRTMRTALARYTVGGTRTWADEVISCYFGKDRPNELPLP